MAVFASTLARKGNVVLSQILRSRVCAPVSAISVALLFAHGALLVHASHRDGPTINEPVHMVAGLRLWQTGHLDIDVGNTPLIQLWSTLLLRSKCQTDWSHLAWPLETARDFLAINGQQACDLVEQARLACIPFSILGGLICFFWAAQAHGKQAGLLALWLWAFCPNVLAYGHLVTADMAATSLGITAAFFFWKWLMSPSWVSFR